MKLELKHIAPYLPYGLKYKDIPEGFDGIRGLNINNIDWCLHNGKPILHPMSDLTNDKLRIEMIKAEHSSHIDWTTDEREGWIEKYGRDRWLNDIPFVITQYLFEHHYDVFGLIPQGLAIDINTL